MSTLRTAVSSWGVPALLAVVGLAAACASRGLDEVGERTAGPGAADQGAGGARPDAEPPIPASPPPPPASTTGSDEEGAEEEEVAFDDPGCPPTPTPASRRRCDPLADAGGCGPDRGCFPYVEYPSSPCEREQYGTRCETAGTARQGEPCLRGGCAPGYLCVASHRGSICARLCELPGRAGCPPGLVCSAVDIEGYGVCY